MDDLTLLNDHRETIGAALKFLGHSLNTTNDAELAALLSPDDYDKHMDEAAAAH